MSVGITKPSSSRLYALDIARGWAIVAMVIFHFAWNLEFFGFAQPGLTASTPWKLFARSIASSFLFLAGLSLVLAHHQNIRWEPFSKRFLMITAAALIVTIGTYFATPDAFVFFGILHSIAAASIVGLLLLRVPAVILIGLALAAFLAPYYLRADVFNTPWLWWVGLSATIPRSNDYVPLLPWLAPFMLGMSFAKFGIQFSWFKKLIEQQKAPHHFSQILAFGGRHALAIYLIHQPVLFGIVWLLATRL